MRNLSASDLYESGALHSTSSSGVLVSKVSQEFGVDSVSVQLEDMFHVQYMTHLGHTGAALCVDGSDGMDWVLSGGSDGTMRLWHYSNKHYACYRCANIWDYSEADNEIQVTSVAICSKLGPAVCCTNTGKLIVVALQSLDSTQMAMPLSASSGMVDVRVKKFEQKRGEQSTNDLWQSNPKLSSYKSGNKGTFLLASAGGKKAFFTEVHAQNALGASFTNLTDDGAQNCKYELQAVQEFPHDAEVTMAVHVPGDIKDGTCLATAAGDDIILWNINAQQVYKLPEPYGKKITCFHISRATAGWIAAAAENGDHGRLHFWPLLNGDVAKDERASDKSPFIVKKPIVSWEINGGMTSVMLDPGNNFVMLLRKDKTAEYKTLAPCPEDNEKKTVEEYPSLEIASGGFLSDKDFLLEIGRTCKEMCIAYDDEDGWVALMAFEDGSVEKYDVDGEDRGQLSASMRSTGILEALEPFIMLFVSSIQVMSFAFGPATSYADSIDKPIKIAREISYVDIRIAFSIDRRDLFLPQIYVVAGVMVIFIVNALSDTPRHLQRHLEFRVRQKIYSETGTCLSFLIHVWVGIVSVIRFLIDCMVLLCATVFVVPMFQVCVKVLDCHHAADGSVTLSENNRIHCYSTEHWNLVKLLGVVVPLYLAVLIPHVVVLGDCKYMPLRFILAPRKWRAQARRKATVKYSGPLHPNEKNFFWNRLVTLSAKIFLPCFVTLSTSRPLMQTCGVAFVGFCLYVNSLQCSLVVERRMLRITQGIQLFTFLCMCCGIATVFYPHCTIPLYLLGVAFIIASVVTIVGVRASSIQEEIQPAFAEEKNPGDGYMKLGSHVCSIDSRVAGE